MVVHWALIHKPSKRYICECWDITRQRASGFLRNNDDGLFLWYSKCKLNQAAQVSKTRVPEACLLTLYHLWWYRVSKARQRRPTLCGSIWCAVLSSAYSRVYLHKCTAGRRTIPHVARPSVNAKEIPVWSQVKPFDLFGGLKPEMKARIVSSRKEAK